MKFVRTMSLFVLFSAIIFISSTALAKTYYVKPNGDDSNSGLSDSQAWKTIAKVNSFNFSTGDDVLFKCGGKWNITYDSAGYKSLWVDWSGSSTDSAIIGSYYVDSSGEVEGVQGNKPIFNGCWNGTTKSEIYSSSLIVVSEKRSFITIKNIRIQNSIAKGLDVSGQNSHINVIGVDVDLTWNAGIRFKTVSTGTIEKCNITRTGKCRILGASDYPASLAMNQSCSNLIVRNCKVHDNWGEGIGAYWYSNHITIENNTVYNNKVNIYVSHGRYFYIRDNLVFGTADDSTYWISGKPGHGINVNDEDGWQKPEYLSYIYIYKNYVANCSCGIGFNKNGIDPGRMIDVKVFNNTIVGCATGISHWHSNGVPVYSGDEFRNNIIWTLPGDKPANVLANNIDWSNNVWFGSGDLDPDINSSNDKFADPHLAKQTGWKSMVDDNSISKASFYITNLNSDAIEGGVVMNSVLQDSNISLCWDGKYPDIGANEYGSNCPETLSNDLDDLEPPVLKIFATTN